MNPYKFSFFCIKKKQSQQNKKKIKKIFVEKKYYKFHCNFFTWQRLTKYTFSSIYKNPQAPFFLWSKAKKVSNTKKFVKFFF